MIGARTDQVRGLLRPFLEAGIFGALEVHATESIASACLSSIDTFDAVSLASAVWATQQGHVCFDVDNTVPWGPLAPSRRPDPEAWSTYLASSPIVHLASDWNDVPDGTTPLIVHDRRIYLLRQWMDEKVVADRVLHRRTLADRVVDTSIVDELFDSEDRSGRQYEAVRHGLRARTSIVTGGPGTGKTYTIARLLVAAAHTGVGSIALAAPTAKAAVRMRESLVGALADDLLDLSVDHRRLLERLEPVTIHRLLGSRQGSSTRFHHGVGRHLPFDLVVIDEMSMVSLPLMARLLEALDDETSVVLVGDPDQLDSVENGSILRDISDVDLGSSIPLTVLETSRRNRGTRSSAFATATRLGDGDGVRSLLVESDDDETLRWIETATPLAAIASLSDMIGVWRDLARFARAGDIAQALDMVDLARVLCAHREGPYGVTSWNAHLSEAIADSRHRWRPGDIVVKTRNDLGQGLSNGDTGVVVRVEDELLFAFRHGTDVVRVPVAVDDAVQLAFATTVHKAQGSEYQHVAVVVPPASSPLSTRELLYTAMTRAKPRATLIGTVSDAVHAVETRRTRTSGLGDRIQHV